MFNRRFWFRLLIIKFFKRLTIEVIKLDRLFLINSYDIQRSQEIIKAIVEMAKTINIKTVAEGVETPSQLEF